MSALGGIFRELAQDGHGENPEERPTEKVLAGARHYQAGVYGAERKRHCRLASSALQMDTQDKQEAAITSRGWKELFAWILI
jgi:hypothetical protein